MNTKQRLKTFTPYEVVTETEKAILFDLGHDEVWLPKSLVEDNGDGSFTIPYSVAIEKGIE